MKNIFALNLLSVVCTSILLPNYMFRELSKFKIVLWKRNKTAKYDDRQKMKRDVWVKVVFFLRKRTTFNQASLHFQAVVIPCGFSRKTINALPELIWAHHIMAWTLLEFHTLINLGSIPQSLRNFLSTHQIFVVTNVLVPVCSSLSRNFGKKSQAKLFSSE